MSDFAWHDVLTDEDPIIDFESDPVPAATTKLPPNKSNPEKEEQGQPAAGDLPEKDTDKGLKKAEGDDLGYGQNGLDDISGLFEDKADDEDKEDTKDDKDPEGDAGEEASDDKDADKDDKAEDEDADKKTKDSLKNFDEQNQELKDFESDDPGKAKTALPPNKSNPEKEEQGQPAAGDLPEKDTDKGMKEADGGDLGYGQEVLDDICNILQDSDDMIDQGEEEGSDDDGASKDGDAKGEDGEDKEDKADKDDKKASEASDKKDDKEDKKAASATTDKKDDKEDKAKDEKDEKKDDEEEVKDFADFFVDADTEVPEGPDGAKLKPADPKDGDGNGVCPIGDPDLPKTLTEPVKVPADGTTKDSADADRRFAFFGDF